MTINTITSAFLLTLLILTGLYHPLAFGQSDSLNTRPSLQAQNKPHNGFIGKQLQFYIDSSGEKTIEDIAKLDSTEFITSEKDVLNFGFINKNVWLKWVLKDNHLVYQNSVINIEFSAINDIEYYFDKDGKQIKLFVTGTSHPFNTRPFKLPHFSFPLEHKGQMPETIYIKARASNALIIPAKILSKEALLAKTYKHTILWGALFGLLGLMSIINLILFMLCKKNYHLYYMGYTLFVGLTLSSLSGHGFMILWPNRPDVNSYSIAFFTCTMIFFGIMFSLKFLSVDEKFNKKTYGIGLLIAGCSLLVSFASIFVDFDMAFFAAIVAAFFAPYAAYIGLCGIRKNIVGARVFTAAWTIFLSGVSCYALIVLDLIDASLFKMHLKDFGAASEILLLSIGVAIQMKNAMDTQNELQYQMSRILTERNEALIKSSKNKEDFFNIMTHELRTPMNGIIGSLDNLKDCSEIESANKAYFSAKSASNEMMRLIENLLLFQEISSGDVAIDQRPIHFSKALDKTVKHFTHICRKKNLIFEYQPHGELPEYVCVDGYKLFTSIYKVLDNAIKFTEKGKITLKLAYLFTEGPGYFDIHIIDSGYGIESEKLELLFNPFEQNDSGLRRETTGLGLGLVLVKGLIKLLDGQVSVQSTLHCGTSVCLKIPAKRATHGKPLDFDWGEDEYETPKLFQLSFPTFFNNDNLGTEGADEAHNPDSHTQSDPIHSLHVLIVEDNPTNALMMKTFTKRLGYTYDHAVNGAIAVKLFHEKSFDIIFMDIQMPVMDGIEATLQIRQIEQDSETKTRTPIIACTANTTMNERKKCLDSGMDAFLAKPIKSNALKEQIDLLLPNHESTSSLKNVIDFKNKK